MKEKGTTKCLKRQWSGNISMAQTPQPEVKSPQLTSHSFLQVDNGIHFIVEGDEVKFSSPVPVDKNIELAHNAYSKKDPLAFHPLLSPDRIDTFDSDLSDKTKVNHQLQPSNLIKCPSKTKIVVKREKSVPLINGDKKKIHKKLVTSKVTILKPSSQRVFLGESSKMGSSMAKQPQSPPSKHKLLSYDKKLLSPKSSPLEEDDSDIEVLEEFVQLANQNGRRTPTAQNGVKRKATGELSVGISKKRSITNHVSRSYTTDNEALINEADTAPFMPINPKGFAEVHSASNSMRWMSTNGDMSVSMTTQRKFSSSKIMTSTPSRQCDLELPDSSQTKQAKGRRELKSLFENLNEISWTHEASFRNMLRSPNVARHSERGSGLIKALRTKKKQIKVVASQAKKKSSNLKVLALKRSRSKDVTSSKCKVIPILNKIRKHNLQREKKLALALKVSPKNDIKRESSKSPESVKSESKALPKLKTSIKVKQSISKISPKIKSEPSTSSSFNGQPVASSSSQMPSLKHYMQNFQAHNKVVTGKSPTDKQNLQGAMQRGKKCKVVVRPLEHTSFWTPSFYEEFRKNYLDKAVQRAIDNKDPDSIAVMFKDFLTSILSPSLEGGDKVAGEGKVKAKKGGPGGEEETPRASARQSESSFRYKEIVVKKHPTYLQIILVPNEIKQNCLSIEAMREIRDSFLLAKKDPNVRAVLLNSSGRYFCCGIDLSQLVGANKRQNAEDMANAIHDLVLTLGTFTKPIIAVVNGATYGFGVSLLTYCDVVLASDKASFCVPAIKLGYVPEGGITLTLPTAIGTCRANEVLMQCRCLTAEEALSFGLVTEIMWPTSLISHAIPRLQNILSQPLSAMEATKTMIRYNLWEKLKPHVDRERRLLGDLWMTSHCQNNMKRLLQTGYVID